MTITDDRPRAATGGLDPAEVLVGTNNGPGLYKAPVGTAPPADTTTDWGTGWVALGYASADGVTLGSSTDSNDITPWQSTSPIRTIITGRSMTLQFVLWQTNPDTMGLYFDAPPPTAGGGGDFSFDVRSDGGGLLYAVGVDILDNGQVIRVVFPRASLSAAGDASFVRGEAVGWDITLAALDDSGVLATVMYGPAAGAGAPPATGATAGSPGTYTPAGAAVPANLAALSTVTASPTTAWTTGQHVVLGDAAHAHWDGTTWVTGNAP